MGKWDLSGVSAGKIDPDKPADRSTIADGWRAAVADLVSGADLPAERIVPMVERLCACAEAATFSADDPFDIGRQLAELGFSVDALRRSVEFLAAGLRPPSIPENTARTRIAQLLAALTEGYLDRETTTAHALATVFDNSAIGFALVDDEGTVLRVNPSLCALAGRTAGELRGSGVAALFVADGPAVEGLCGGRVVRTEARLAGDDGESTAVLLEVTPLGPTQRALVTVNVADTRSLTDALIRQSLGDVVTGLPNRQQFTAWLERACAGGGAGTVGLVHFDVDGFHVVNDALGHDVGDRVLRSVGHRLSDACEGLGRVARTGGDEFTVLVETPENTLALVRLVEEVDALLAEPVYLDDAGIGLTVSTGISVCRVVGASPTELARTAEVAARWSREDGRARWTLYDPARDARERDRFTVAATVAGAMGEGEIEVCYTPVFSLAAPEVVAVEAALRWNHPERGPLTPAQFRELAETTGSTLRLGYLVLDDACAAGGRWLAEFGERAPVVAVRLSHRQSKEPELAASVRRVLDRAGLPPVRLQLLVGDDVLMAMDEDQREELENLVAGGVTVVREQRGGGRFDALAGSGVRLAGIKVDSTVVGALAEGADPVVRSAAVGMLKWANHNLGMDVYAEGVTTADQAETLARLGVVAGLGPHYGELLTGEEIHTLLRTGPS
ncbi:EAL domain-containing protein [Actinophytocola sp.]|uniref:EAL domain-containing protein n=1 Tax=Actinophytocola sp. TaxID=1872138 RepID=UPI002D26A885|nr:EAL domain-containing protein [Actinophytocola sp.]HYQ62054.1 EAL domain-containing protein [Actinophytocola sp.]